jgi:hypothetical protein
MMPSVNVIFVDIACMIYASGSRERGVQGGNL